MRMRVRKEKAASQAWASTLTLRSASDFAAQVFTEIRKHLQSFDATRRPSKVYHSNAGKESLWSSSDACISKEGFQKCSRAYARCGQTLTINTMGHIKCCQSSINLKSIYCGAWVKILNCHSNVLPL